MFLWRNSCCFLQKKLANMFWRKKLLKFLPCFPHWKGLNVPPRDSQCWLEFSQLMGLSYCLTFSPHLFFFTSHRAPNRILFPLKMETLMEPCNILRYLQSWESALKKTIFFLWLIPLDFFSNQSFTFLSSDFQMLLFLLKDTKGKAQCRFGVR